jgi:hypothetical protein
MSTATTTDTGQTTSRRTTTPPSTTPQERAAASSLRSTFVPGRIAFTRLGTRKTLLPEQRDTAARTFHADRGGAAEYRQFEPEAKRRVGTRIDPASTTTKRSRD